MSLQELCLKNSQMLKFRKAAKEDIEKISSLISDTARGAVAFSVLYASSDDASDFFFLGEDESAVIKSIVFDTGDEYFLLYGEEFPEIFARCEKTVMIYNKNTAESGDAQMLQGREILALYKLLSGKSTLSFDDERRYVLRLRAVNVGLAAVFGIREGERLVSSASISSMNEKYAVISDVFTDENYRSRGLARRCLMSAAEYSLKKGRIPILLCDEKMCPYYEKAGFVIYGKM